MPTYEYVCRSCDTHLDAVQRFDDAALTECPACGGALRKVFGSIGIAFKGSGFYKNDSRLVSRSGPAKVGEGGKDAGEAGSAKDGKGGKDGQDKKDGKDSKAAGSDGGSKDVAKAPAGGAATSDSSSSSSSSSSSAASGKAPPAAKSA